MRKWLLSLLLLSSMSANASIISLSLSETDVEVGDTVTVTVSATDFVNVEVLDLDILFDTLAFDFVLSSFASDVFEQSDFPGGVVTFDLIRDALLDTNRINLAYVDFTSGLNALTGSFSLASFDLVANQAGSFDVGFSVFDFFGFAQLTEFEGTELLNVTAARVNEPATLGLFAGLIALMMVKRRNR